MNKGEFLTKYNTAIYLSQRAFNKLGLKSKTISNEYKNLFEELADEEYYLRAEFASKNEDGTAKKDSNQQLIVTLENEILLISKLKAWKKEEVEVTVSSKIFIPTFPKDENLFKISPEIYDTLNGFVFELDEEIYFDILGQNDPS